MCLNSPTSHFESLNIPPPPILPPLLLLPPLHLLIKLPPNTLQTKHLITTTHPSKSRVIPILNHSFFTSYFNTTLTPLTPSIIITPHPYFFTLFTSTFS